MAFEPATGLTVGGVPVMSMTPISRALASATSLIDLPWPTLSGTGSIHTLPEPRHHAMLPVLMSTRLSTARSCTSILSVDGNSRT